MIKKKIQGLSSKEVEIIAWLEFYDKYFFTIDNIKHFFSNKTQRYNYIKNLVKKKRIIKLNRNKYYLIPIKAKSGKWAEDPYVVTDEILNGKDYFIGGWSAANYWHLTEQVPVQIDIYTTKRQGKINIFNTRFVFHRTTKNKIKRTTIINRKGHFIRILNKKEIKKWMKSRE